MRASSGFEGRVGIHFVFGKRALAALFVGDQSEQEGIVRGVDEVVAIFLFLRIFFQGFALRAAVIDEQSQGPRQILEIGAIRGEILRFAIVADGNPEHARPRRNDARYFYRCGGRIAGILAGLDAFDAFVEIQGGLALLLVGDNVLEDIRSCGSNRRSGIRHRGLRCGVSGESQRQQRDGHKSVFAHDVKWLETRQSQL